ncbi:MAG: muramoyltetrapeptide carboxypeptidase, partial [Oxalobacteraceae bacterium]|nr:muramoyltetrapeptide carboxypeptidase [Oxalobacteraceae bacterium]
NTFRIGVVAPSGYAADPVAFARGLAHLRSLGHTVQDFSASGTRELRFAGTDEQRIAQLHAAARDPSIEIVIALRGGYGLSRLVPAIDLKLLSDSVINGGKRWVGHSDFTVVQLALLSSGAGTYAGPMICDDFSREDLSDFTQQHFWQCMSQASVRVQLPVHGNPRVQTDGTLWGGNLTMLCSLLGTPWMPTIKNGILFIEDVNEHPYRVERMLLQLAQAGILDRQRAIVLGDFSGYKLTDYDNGYDFTQMLSYMRERLSIPILQGLPFGHMKDKVTLPVGAHCVLDSSEDSLSLTMSTQSVISAK